MKKLLFPIVTILLSLSLLACNGGEETAAEKSERLQREAEYAQYAAEEAAKAYDELLKNRPGG